ncbi:hypothetical protein BGZ73_002908 [Actinomortierella ambigua]|nr:hypothetical protein BGZ73_002908 [Actinomortierella ambigua]
MNWMGGKRSRAKATSEETLKQRQFFERQRRIRAHKMYTGSFPVTTPTTAAAAASSSSSWPQGKATVTTASSSSWNPLSTSVPSHDIAAAGAKRPLPSPSPLHDTRTPKKMPNRGTAEYDALRLECLARLQTELDWRGKEFALMAYASRIVSSTPQVRVPESGSNRSGSSSSRASSLCGDDSTRASIQRQPHHHHRDSHSHRHHRYDDQSHRHHANELISSHGAIVGLHPAQKGPAEGRESGTDQQQQESDSQSSRFSPTPDKEQLLWRGCYQSIVAKATPELHPAEEKEEEEQEEEKNEADQQKQRSVLVAAVQQPQLAEGPANSNGATHDHIVDPLYDNDEVNNTDDEGEEDEPLIMPVLVRQKPYRGDTIRVSYHRL